MKNKVLTAAMAMVMVAAIAAANGPGHGPGGPGGFQGGGPGDFGGPGPEGGLLVGSNGSVFIVSGTYDSATNSSTTTVKAVSSTGAVLWSRTLNVRARFELSGSNLLTIDDVAASDGTITSTITAISTSTGATAWTKSVTGRITSLTPFNGGTYAVVVVPATTTGGTATRSLVAISDAGATLWSITL